MTRILVVDDDRAVASSLAAMLEYEEMDVTVARDGLGGVEAAQPGAFDLIIVDIFMPGMNGIEVIKAIRTRDLKVPIIAITGFLARGATGAGEGNVLAEAVAVGATVSMEKPFKRPEIVRAVVTCLERSRRSARRDRVKFDAASL